MLGFRYYFTPLTGVLFIFRSRYYSLSVVEEYLALEGGPSGFTPGFSCLVLLGNTIARPCSFAYGAITRCGGTFQDLRLEHDFLTCALDCNPTARIPQPRSQNACRLAGNRFGQSFPFARRYLGNRVFFLFLRLLRCFSSPRSLPRPMDSVVDNRGYPVPFPDSEICGSMPSWRLAAALRSRPTSFIASRRQDIHQTPLST